MRPTLDDTRVSTAVGLIKNLDHKYHGENSRSALIENDFGLLTKLSQTSYSSKRARQQLKSEARERGAAVPSLSGFEGPRLSINVTASSRRAQWRFSTATAGFNQAIATI